MTKRRWGNTYGLDNKILLLEARIEALEQQLAMYRAKEITHQ